MKLEHLNPESVVVQDRMRPPDEKLTMMLVGSIREQGLLHPIVVRRSKDVGGPRQPILICGAHRLAAVKRLRHKTIPCHVMESDDLQARINEIDENLKRGELSKAQFAIHVTMRKELYEEAHPRSKTGSTPGAGRGKKPSSQGLHDGVLVKYTSKAADDIGTSPTTIMRAQRHGKALGAHRLEQVTGTSLDGTEQLDALAHHDMPERMRDELINKAINGEDVKARPILDQIRQENGAMEKDRRVKEKQSDYTKNELRKSIRTQLNEWHESYGNDVLFESLLDELHVYDWRLSSIS